LIAINRLVALVPVAALGVLLAAVLGLGLKGQFVFNPPYLLLALTFLFYFLVTPVVAYVSARGYLATGSLTLLYVCMAFLVGVPFALATGLVASEPNVTVTLAALGLLVSSAFQFVGALQTSFGSVAIGAERRGSRLAVAVVGVLALSMAVIALGLLGVFPAFFVSGSGVTFLDEAVYTCVILLFLLSGLLYLRVYVRGRSRTLYVYGLALLLYSLGSFGMTQQVVFGDVLAWAGRVCTYVGLLYFLFALLRSPATASDS
jgi:hypothetical protein